MAMGSVVVVVAVLTMLVTFVAAGWALRKQRRARKALKGRSAHRSSFLQSEPAPSTRFEDTIPHLDGLEPRRSVALIRTRIAR